MQTVVKSRFWSGCWAMHGQPVPAPTHRGTWWFRQQKEEKVGEKLCLVVQHSRPSLCGCSQVRRRSGLRSRVAAFLIVFYLFMIYLMISYNHVTFHKFFTFHKSCDLWSVTISVAFDAATCSDHCCWEPGFHWGHPGTPSQHLLSSSQQEWGLAALQWWLRPQPLQKSLPPPTLWTTFKLFSQQWMCTRCAVGSLIVRSCDKCPDLRQRVGMDDHGW